MSLYNNPTEFFTDIIDYNNNNVEGQLYITNIYYITFLDLQNIEIQKAIDYLTGINYESLYEIKTDINFDEEQMCNINLVKDNIKTIDNYIKETLNNAIESNSKIVVLLDINLVFNILKLFEDKNIEVHLYDFILHILKNKVDKLFILDKENILVNENNKYSSIYHELKIYLLNEKITEDKILNDDIQIYKNYSMLYWRILNNNDTINYIDNEEEDKLEKGMTIIQVNDENAILTTQQMAKIQYSNLFEMHNFVLNPLDKIKIYL